MKALVLAGGTGTRLRPLSYSMPKQLVPIANKPVLLHCLEDIAEIGVRDVGVIVGGHAQEIREEFGDGSALGLRITYLRQDEALGLAHCVLVARDFLGADDFVMYLGDNLLTGGIGAAAREFRARRPAAQILVRPVPDPSAFGVAVTDPSGRVTALVEKPRRPVGNLAVLGVYFFTPAVHEAVAAIEPSGRGELEITDALQWLVAAGHEVRARRFDGFWQDTGRIEDVLRCNRVLLEDITGRIDGEIDADSELSGQVIIEAGAKIVRSRIQGPAIIGADTLVEDSSVGPYASLGRGCVIRDSGVASSILLAEVAVSHVRHICDSLIGRAAQVRTAAAHVPHHRLVIGDTSTVEVQG
ncbi:glucose-1-phosphate thymidylyltransferase [Actinomadura sp. ATCC 31491]|uniref:Glucose-1-phosphate thymidylyltransferase n=1 Tax=Actinomadura luzonensis TaxID=2805427 RepID=A0ABT0G922_9ACTN|nr:glucose-1-phosphate thymidylyltransferase [Actinomadura luzonensis]MCK2221091.1 glucose-1-phosphate thymidylyltransferase [Actinomadura luzonensis]